MDVTLGSLWSESLGVLEGLGWLDGESSEEDEGRIVRSSEGSMGNRGMPYFEEMVEDSRLGRIKRRRGGQVGADGRVVQWEVTEIEGDHGDAFMEGMSEEGSGPAEGENGNKRLKFSG
jgi:hypothetical protein